MTSLHLDSFPPLRAAITQAESWTGYLSPSRPEQLGGRRPEEVAAAMESIVWFGVKLGELLPFTWQLTFANLFRPGEESWTTLKEFEGVRQAVQRLFFTMREALERTRQVGEALQRQTNRTAEGMDRLVQVIQEARRLEEAVFRDWPSFAEPGPRSSADSVPPDESLAAALGISLGEARERMEARRRELYPGRG